MSENPFGRGKEIGGVEEVDLGYSYTGTDLSKAEQERREVRLGRRVYMKAGELQVQSDSNDRGQRFCSG